MNIEQFTIICIKQQTYIAQNIRGRAMDFLRSDTDVQIFDLNINNFFYKNHRNLVQQLQAFNVNLR